MEACFPWSSKTGSGRHSTRFIADLNRGLLLKTPSLLFHGGSGLNLYCSEGDGDDDGRRMGKGVGNRFIRLFTSVVAGRAG